MGEKPFSKLASIIKNPFPKDASLETKKSPAVTPGKRTPDNNLNTFTDKKERAVIEELNRYDTIPYFPKRTDLTDQINELKSLIEKLKARKNGKIIKNILSPFEVKKLEEMIEEEKKTIAHLRRLKNKEAGLTEVNDEGVTHWYLPEGTGEILAERIFPDGIREEFDKSGKLVHRFDSEEQEIPTDDANASKYNIPIYTKPPKEKLSKREKEELAALQERFKLAGTSVKKGKNVH